MPASFEFLDNNRADLFVPLVLSGQPVAVGRSVMVVNVIARLMPGLTIGRAQLDLAVINRRLQAAYPGGFAKMMAGAQARVVPLLFALAVSVATGILCGLAPAVGAARSDLVEGLKEGAQVASAGRRRGWLHGAIAVAELSLALVLLVGAGLLIKSPLGREVS